MREQQTKDLSGASWQSAHAVKLNLPACLSHCPLRGDSAERVGEWKRIVRLLLRAVNLDQSDSDAASLARFHRGVETRW